MRHERDWKPQSCRLCSEEGVIIVLIAGRPYTFCSRTHAEIFRVLATGSGSGLKKRRV
jgi:hypothetical protein